MTAQQDPYVRVYYRVIDDPKFRDVFDDDARLACWLRLLLIADGTYPAPAPIPAGVRRSAFQHLVTVGLIDLEPGNRFRIHGMDTERGVRSRKASDAARKRWGDADAEALAMRAHSTSNASASGTNMHSAPLLSAPIRSAPSSEPERHGLPHITTVSQTVAETITGMGILSAGEKQLTEWDRLVEFHGEAKVAEAFQTVAAGRRLSYRQLVWDTVKVLEPFAKPQAVEEAKRSGETEADWKRRTDASRQSNAEMRRAMGYDDAA